MYFSMYWKLKFQISAHLKEKVGKSKKFSTEVKCLPKIHCEPNARQLPSEIFLTFFPFFLLTLIGQFQITHDTNYSIVLLREKISIFS